MTTFTGPPRESGYYWRRPLPEGRADIVYFDSHASTYSPHWAGTFKSACGGGAVGVLREDDDEWSGPIPNPFEKEEEKG